MIKKGMTQKDLTKKDMPKKGMMNKEVMNKEMSQQDMKADMLRRMGPYTPREFYPSLMQLPDLSPEKRAEIKRLASLRMEDGLQILTKSRAALTAATESNDLSGMEQAAADMRAAVARYESGLAALRALEDGEGPREIALSWFRREMDLDSSTTTGSAAIGLGMTPFHMTLCVFLVLFASAMVWMYFLRMRRAAALLHQLSQPPTSSDAKP